MSIKAQLEALIYAAEEPITLDQMVALLRDDLLALKTAPAPEYSPMEPHPAQADDHLGAVEEEDAAATFEEHSAGKDQPSQTKPGQSKPGKDKKERTEKAELRALLKPYLEELIASYQAEDRGIEVR